MQTTQEIYDVVIVGAGPYGLSVAANLLKKKLRVAIFGKPMSFWRNHIPQGMLLRSRWWANSLSDPAKKYTITNYFESIGIQPYDPIPEEVLCEYGLWFQRHAVPTIDETYVRKIKKQNDFFVVSLMDGRTVMAKSVIMATGLAYFAYRPEIFTHIPEKFVSHTVDNRPFSQFTNKTVVVIGSGQSALENAALMSEQGITVHVIHRSPLRFTTPEKKSLYYKIRYPRAGITDGWDKWLLERFPYVFHGLPQWLKNIYIQGKGANGPIGTYWLKPRIKNVIFHSQTYVEVAEVISGRLHLILSDQTSIVADHIVLATGYRIDVSRLPMLDKALVKDIQTYRGNPKLQRNFESSVQGLYFTGISSAVSFGPLYRFVTGVDATAKKLARVIKPWKVTQHLSAKSNNIEGVEKSSVFQPSISRYLMRYLKVFTARK